MPAAICLVLVGFLGCSGTGDAQSGAGRRWSRSEQVEALRTRAMALLPEIEALSTLPARAPIALGIRARSDLETYLVEQLERQLPPEKSEAVVRVYARLGLVPAGLELEPLLRALLLEQVVGYYDPARDTLYVVAGVDSTLVEAVLAHELVHALQDQHQDLDSLMRANLDRNDRANAAQAALEGHATLAMLEWQLGRLSGGAFEVEDLPDFAGLADADLIRAGGLEMPALASAPRILRESLLFPYVGGLRFTRARNRALGGRGAPLGDALPVSTEQVLHPERSLGADLDEPVPIRFAEPPEGWREIRADALGEFEARIWLDELLGNPDRAARAAEGWDGDRYRLLEGPSGEALVWISTWDSRRDAAEFADAARDALARRYPKGGRTVTVWQDSAPYDAVVTILDGPEGIPRDVLDTAARAEIGQAP